MRVKHPKEEMENLEETLPESLVRCGHLVKGNLGRFNNVNLLGLLIANRSGCRRIEKSFKASCIKKGLFNEVLFDAIKNGDYTHLSHSQQNEIALSEHAISILDKPDLITQSKIHRPKDLWAMLNFVQWIRLIECVKKYDMNDRIEQLDFVTES